MRNPELYKLITKYKEKKTSRNRQQIENWLNKNLTITTTLTSEETTFLKQNYFRVF